MPSTPLDEFIESAKALKIRSATAHIGSRYCDYDITSKTFEPRVPYFVGYPDRRYLFISEEVPEEFHPAVLAHELWCARQKGRGDPDHCRHAAVHELLYVPNRAFKAYLDMRLKTFEALVELYGSCGDTDFVRAATASRDQFRMLVSDPGA